MFDSRLPVTVVTGFLGSGKTTLLRHLLSEGHQRLAVVVNEFGTVGLDGDLLKKCGFCPDDEVDERIVELNNGCLCCTVQEDFLPAMEALLIRSNQLDGIIIETSGLALPKPLLQAINWPSIRSKVFINGVVTLVDGSYHDVDSSEMAFKIAGSMAFKDGIKKCNPVLLEPMMKVEVEVPEDFLGSIIGDLSSRRGQVEGQSIDDGQSKVQAKVPLAEMFGYATQLRSMTQGRGIFSMEFSTYEEVPRNVAEAIISKNQGNS